MNRFAILAAFLGMAAAAVAGDEAEAPASPDAAAWAQIKSLAGKWQGTFQEGDNGNTLDVAYEVVSDGKAVIERMFAGTPHEMITVFYMSSGKLQATHYCSIGNQPAYRLTSFDEGRMVFGFSGGTGFDPKKDDYASGASIKVLDADRVESSWSFNKGEQANGGVKSTLRRVRT
jgi:hypothetical protein